MPTVTKDAAALIATTAAAQALAALTVVADGSDGEAFEVIPLVIPLEAKPPAVKRAAVEEKPPIAAVPAAKPTVLSAGVPKATSALPPGVKSVTEWGKTRTTFGTRYKGKSYSEAAADDGYVKWMHAHIGQCGAAARDFVAYLTASGKGLETGDFIPGTSSRRCFVDP